MKVMHVVSTLGSGGAERQLYLLCRESAAQVEHSVVAVTAEGRWAEGIRSLGIPIHCLATSMRNPLALFRLRAAISNGEPHVIHSWLPSANILSALAAGSRPVIASVRNVDDWKPFAYRLFERVVSPLWRAVVCNSLAGAAQTLKSGVPEGRIFTIHNGLEARHAKPRPINLPVTVCVACRLVPQKRVHLVLETARQMPAIQFLIAGEGRLRPELEAQAPSNVEFLGHLDDIYPMLARSHVFLSTSEREGMSNSLLEAMQAGCVPVVTPAGDNAKIVEDRISGRVAGPEGLFEAIRWTLPRLDELSAAARQGVQRYTVSAMAGQTVSLYRRVLETEIAHASPLPGLHQ